MGDYDKKKYTNMVKTGLQNNDYNYKKHPKHPKHPKQKHKVQSGIHIVYQNDSKSDEVEDVNYYKPIMIAYFFIHLNFLAPVLLL